MPAWPATLPQSPLRRGYSETLPDTSIATEMDVGPAKVRRRTTAGVAQGTWQFDLTASEVAILRTFYQVTLVSGTLTFTHAHPMTGTEWNWRIIKPPQISGDGDSPTYMVSISVEQRPT